jgi:hypothetical protein
MSRSQRTQHGLTSEESVPLKETAGQNPYSERTPAPTGTPGARPVVDGNRSCHHIPGIMAADVKRSWKSCFSRKFCVRQGHFSSAKKKVSKIICELAVRM